MQYYGYAGTVLYVNLTTGEVKKEPLDLDLAKRFIGGAGINYKLAYDLIKPGTNPFSPENPLIIGVGPLIGTTAPGAAKVLATTKFPIPASADNRYFIASASGGSFRFGVMLKNAGYDNLVITGKAKSPVYLKIVDENVEICEAGDFWSKKDAYETFDELNAKYPGCGVISIGRGGENLVRFAMAWIDKRNHLGRGGLGAVMGSKNLKAIIALGTKGVRVSNPERFNKEVERLSSVIIKHPMVQAYHDKGTHAAWDVVGINMTPGIWKRTKWDSLYGNIEKFYEVKGERGACTACLVGCKGSLRIKDGEFAGLEMTGSHYLQVCILGQELEIDNPRKAMKLLDAFNRDGMCLQAAVSIMDWLTRLYKDGLISEKDTGGLVLKRDFNTYMDLEKKMANREGLGYILGEGWFEISKHIGRDARVDYVRGRGIVKGNDAIYSARVAKLDPLRFTIMTNPRGAQHSQGHSQFGAPLLPLETLIKDVKRWGTPKEALERLFTPGPYYGAFNTGRLTAYIEDFHTIFTSLGLCSLYATFGFLSIDSLAELYSAATGLEVSPEELRTMGERTFNLFKVLNVREGFDRKDDSPPDVWFIPLSNPERTAYMTDYYHMRRLSKEDVEKLLTDYYDERGWDPDKGVPTRRKLEQIGLNDATEAVPK